MKIVFFGTSNFALPILEALMKAHEVLAVVTTPDAPVGRKQELTESPVSALARDLKLTTFKPEQVKGNQEFLEQLKQLCTPTLHPHPPFGHLPPKGEGGTTGGADVFVVSSYGMILPTEIIELPKLKTLNTHPSALPRYRGPTPIQAALLNGDAQTGTSIIILDEDVDHGPLLGQKIVDISPDDNYFTLEDRLAKASADLLLEALADYQAGKITPLPQDDSQATFTKIITKEDGRINWEQSAEQIYNQFRAFYVWPGIWTTWRGKKLKILDCVVNADQLIGHGFTDTYGYGTVIEGGKVVCGGGSLLQIKSLQPEGRSEMSIKDFLNGNKEFVGSKLE